MSDDEMDESVDGTEDMRAHESPAPSESNALVHPIPPLPPLLMPPSEKNFEIEGVCELMEVRKRVEQLMSKPEVDKAVALEIAKAMMDMERLLHRERTQRGMMEVKHKLECQRLESEMDRLARSHMRDSLQFQKIESVLTQAETNAGKRRK